MAVSKPATAGVKRPAVSSEAAGPRDRHERYEATRPDGVAVIIDRNIDTGEQSVTEK